MQLQWQQINIVFITCLLPESEVLPSTEIAFLMAVSCLPITGPNMFTRLGTSTADILVKILTC